MSEAALKVTAQTRPKALTKAQREHVRLLFGGHCAYCGIELGKSFHVDHVKPVIRVSPTSMWNAHNHHIDNMWPACAPCNLDKAQQGIESFREWLTIHLGVLRKKSIYRNCLRHGLIQETGAKVVFYFERVAQARGTTPEQRDGDSV